MDDAREFREQDLDAELARELAGATAADLAELVELARHLDHRLRRGAGLPDPDADPAMEEELASPSTVQIDGEAVIEAMHVALGEAERASIVLRGALERAHHLAERLRRI